MPRPAKQNQYSQIGQNIKLVREWKRMSPKVFADEMDVTVHTVHDWENGKTDLPHYRVVNAAKVFNMSLPKLETAHEWLPVTINTPHDNHVVFNAGTINSEGAALNDCVQELRNQLAQKDGQITKKDEQLAQKDERIALLEKRIDDLLEKLSSRV